MSRAVYLDYAAATPLDPQVKQVMEPYFSDKFHNPSAVYLAAQAVRQDLENARALIAKNLSVKASEIIFTAGATEANNLAIQGVMSKYPGSEVLVSAIEHDSVSEPAARFKSSFIEVDNQGIIRLEDLKNAISDDTALISVILVSHELGTVQPLRDISRFIADVRHERLKRGVSTPIYLHTDASQVPNCLALNISKLGVDMASINGGKIYGPKQSGALYTNKQARLEPLIVGGGQEGGLRAGTENVAGAVGLASALDIAQRGQKAEFERLRNLRLDFAKLLQKQKINSVINGTKKQFSPHVLSITFAGQDNERLMMELDELGIICAVGSACKADSDRPSKTLSAIGLTKDQARSTLRFSFGRQTTVDDVAYTAETLGKIIGLHR